MVGVALLASAVLHSGVGIVAGTMGIGMSADGSPTLSGRAGDPADPGLLVWTEPPESQQNPDQARSESTPESPSTPVLVAIAPKQPPASTPPPELRLGLAKSPHKTDNWLGDVVKTPHSGLPSSVDQPELSLNPGAPGVPMARPGDSAAEPRDAAELPLEAPKLTPDRPSIARQSPTKTPELPDGPSTPPVATINRPGKADAARDGSASANPPTATDTIDQVGVTDGDPDAVGDQIARLGVPAPQSTDTPSTLDRITPDTAPPEPGDWDAVFAIPTSGVETGAPTGDPALKQTVVAMKRTAPAEARPAPQTAPRVPSDAGPFLPTSPMSPAPASPLGVAGPAGSGGSSPGQQSERESDASAIDPEPEVRPGMPWAGEGLEVFTRRIELSLFSRSTRAFRSPLLKVTFDRSGTVTNIEVLESSGSPDVDDSTRNSVYKWTARGTQLEELAPGAGLSMNFRILLRGR